MKKLVNAVFLAAGLLSLTGCTPQQNPEPPAYSIVIEDVTAAPETTAQTVPETMQQTAEITVTAAAETSVPTTAPTSAAQTAASTQKTKSAKQTTASSYLLTQPLTGTSAVTTTAKLNPDGSYTTKEDVSLYIYTYKKLPKNFITKKDAQARGWNGGSLEPYAKGCSIGGSVFGNYEGLLPKKKGRTYYECDIDTRGKSSRGAKRIVYSDDGLIYYTGDHYQTFELLYGEVS